MNFQTHGAVHKLIKINQPIDQSVNGRYDVKIKTIFVKSSLFCDYKTHNNANFRCVWKILSKIVI